MPVSTSPLPSKSRNDLCAFILHWRERVENSDPYMSQLNNFPQPHASSYAPNSQRVRRLSGVSVDTQQASKRAACYDSGIWQPFTPDSNNESLPHQDYSCSQSHPHGPELSFSAPAMKSSQVGAGFLDMWGEPKTEHLTVGYENNRPQYVAEDDSLRQNHYQPMSGIKVAGAPSARSGPWPVNVIPLATGALSHCSHGYPPPMNYLPDPTQLEVLKVLLEQKRINSELVKRRIESDLEKKRIYWERVGEFVSNATTLLQSGARDLSRFEASVQQHAQMPVVFQSAISTPTPAPVSFSSAPSSGVLFSAPGGA